MKSLAGYAGADYSAVGVLDYTDFQRATQFCCNEVWEKTIAFGRVVFNVALNSRDAYPRNFAYLMFSGGQWSLVSAYDVTFCEGSGGRNG